MRSRFALLVAGAAALVLTFGPVVGTAHAATVAGSADKPDKGPKGDTQLLCLRLIEGKVVP